MAESQNRGQSEVIGTLLIVALIIISISTVGAVILYSSTQNWEDQTTHIDCTIEYSNDNITITHGGGESVEVDSLSTVLRNDSSQSRLSFEISEGNGDEERFNPGDSAVFGPISEETKVLLIGEDDVICQSTVRPQPTTTPTTTTTTNQPPTAMFTSSRTGEGKSDNVDLDATSSSDPDGSTISYEWDVGDDGTVDYRGETVKNAMIPSGTTVTLTVTEYDGANDSVSTVID